MLTFLVLSLKTLEAINILDYMMADYPLAIVDTFEWEEMKDFSRRLRILIPRQSVLVDSLIHMVDSRADTADVRGLLERIREELLSHSTLRMFPDGMVSLEKGREIYERACAVCHGERGDGMGRMGDMNPPPANFIERGDISPFRVYTVLHFGAPGMPSFDYLSDGDKWNVSFYVMSLRHVDFPGDTFYLPLEFASIWSDDYMSELGLKTEEVAFIRNNPGIGDTISIILHTLSMVERAASGGRFADALSILNGLYARYVEPLEKRMVDASRMEMDFIRLRQSLREGRVDEVKSLTASIGRYFLSSRDNSSWHVPVGAFIILFREGLEAILIIAIMLSIASIHGNRRIIKAVHAGWILAIISGFITWVLFRRVLSGFQMYGEVVEGIASLLAAGILIYVALWFSSGAVNALKRKMGEASRKKAWVGAFILSFLVVYRESFETVLFYSALYDAGNRGGLVAGFVLGVLSIIFMGILVFHLHRRLPVERIFSLTSWILLALAVVFIGKGIREFQETGLLPVHFVDAAPHIDFLGVYPTLEGILAQVIAISLLIYLMVRKVRMPAR